MRLTPSLLALLLAGPALAEPSETAKSLKEDWTRLLAGGCDLDAAHVRTTIEASALRNTPYALKGYAFKAKELTALFTADGGWYAPDPAVKAPAFSPEEQACIKKLKDHEAALNAKVAIDAAFKAKFLGQRDEVLNLRAHTSQLGKGPATLKKLAKSYVLEGAPGGITEINLSCEETECHAMVPGI